MQDIAAIVAANNAAQSQFNNNWLKDNKDEYLRIKAENKNCGEWTPYLAAAYIATGREKK